MCQSERIASAARSCCGPSCAIDGIHDARGFERSINLRKIIKANDLRSRDFRFMRKLDSRTDSPCKGEPPCKKTDEKLSTLRKLPFRAPVMGLR